MIVITIIALLVGVGMPNYIHYLQRAAITEAVSVMADYKLSLGLFWSIEERLPQTGDTLLSTPANLPFDTAVLNTTANPLPDSIGSIELTSSGKGVLITIILQAPVFSNVVNNNKTLVLGAKPSGTELVFACGNYSQDAATITDIGFTDTSFLPNGCNYNGVSTWLST